MSCALGKTYPKLFKRIVMPSILKCKDKIYVCLAKNTIKTNTSLELLFLFTGITVAKCVYLYFLLQQRLNFTFDNVTNNLKIIKLVHFSSRSEESTSQR